MNSGNVKYGLGAVVVVVSLATHALAQFAPPPTEAAPPTREYTPFRPSSLPPDSIRAAPPKPAQGQPPGAGRRPPGTAPVQLPSLPYEPLLKRDAEGKAVPLSEPATWAASRRNPMLSKEDWARLDPVFAARKSECETIAVRNLDLLEKVEGGDLGRIEGDAKQVIKTIREMFQPLTPEGGDFSAKLGKDNLITQQQSNFSQKILSEYNQEMIKDVKAASPVPEKPAGGMNQLSVIRYMYHQRIEETVFAHRWLLDEASRNIDRVLTDAALPPETLSKIDAERKSLSAKPDDAKRAEQMDALMKKLAIDERRKVLSTTIETRVKKN